MSLGDFLVKALIAAVVAGVAALVVKGIIDRRKIQEELRKKHIRGALISQINHTKNKIKLEDLDSDQVLELQGDDIDSSLRVGERIYA